MVTVTDGTEELLDTVLITVTDCVEDCSLLDMTLKATVDNEGINVIEVCSMLDSALVGTTDIIELRSPFVNVIAVAMVWV